jgi:phosphoglucomutase
MALIAGQDCREEYREANGKSDMSLQGGANNCRFAGKPAPASSLINIAKLVAAYYSEVPDPAASDQRVAFGTSGHRGSAFDCSFNEWHILAITQAICQYRVANNINGPLFLGIDTHALSEPACASALEVLAANGVDVMLAVNDEYTPTPAVSHAILTFNRGRCGGFADGIIITPSHNPPRDGGLKYNPPHGGPAGKEVTDAIEASANRFLETRLSGVKRITHQEALKAASTLRYDFLNTYVDDLGSVIDMDVIAAADMKIGVDPMGGAGVHYWSAIADHYDLNLEVVNDAVDSAFGFMALDWDGQIRMDPSSHYAMQGLIDIKDRFDIAFACDTDHDRHGIVTKSAGLLASNDYLSVAIDYLFRHRPLWDTAVGVGKTVVSSRMIDLVTSRLGCKLFETPAGFKWFATGLLDGSLAFAGEESAGATFLRRDGSVWTTDKDGITAGLLAAEMTARTGFDPGQLYSDLAQVFGDPVADRIEASATVRQKKRLAALSANQILSTELAGEKISQILTSAPGNGEPIGGVKVITANGWFAARPSGTEDIYKIYAESFCGEEHLQNILREARSIVGVVIDGESNMSIQPALTS